MKRNPITLITGVVLVLIFGFMLFTFQVRQTEYAVVTTFGKFSRNVTDAGFQFRLPWPIQKVYKFDNRIQTFERKLDQTYTRDQINLVVSAYIGWRIADPRVFLERLNGDLTEAERQLEPMVRNAKNGVISRHPFSDLISTNEAELKFDQIEKEMLAAFQTQARNAYGIQVEILGIQRLELPQTITTDVFNRMRAERQKRVADYLSQGQKAADIIRANADGQANEILANARAEAIKIVGEAEKKAAEHYAEFEKSPDLAVFLFQLKALELSLKERASLILGPRTPPFNLLNGTSAAGSSGNNSNK